jgi:hypothetical protein
MTWDDEDGLLCHLCDAQRPAMDDCEACQGRGRIDEIGFLDSPWDEVAPGLWVGAHDIAPSDGVRGRDEAIVTDEFDVVVSLFRRDGHGPPEGVEHHHHAMPDAEDAASVEALVLMRRGSTADEAIDAIRAARSHNCLFNRHFSDYLRTRTSLRPSS